MNFDCSLPMSWYSRTRRQYTYMVPYFAPFFFFFFLWFVCLQRDLIIRPLSLTCLWGELGERAARKRTKTYLINVKSGDPCTQQISRNCICTYLKLSVKSFKGNKNVQRLGMAYIQGTTKQAKTLQSWKDWISAVFFWGIYREIINMRNTFPLSP